MIAERDGKRKAEIDNDKRTAKLKRRHEQTTTTLQQEVAFEKQKGVELEIQNRCLTDQNAKTAESLNVAHKLQSETQHQLMNTRAMMQHCQEENAIALRNKDMKLEQKINQVEDLWRDKQQEYNEKAAETQNAKDRESIQRTTNLDYISKLEETLDSSNSVNAVSTRLFNVIYHNSLVLILNLGRSLWGTQHLEFCLLAFRLC